MRQRQGYKRLICSVCAAHFHRSAFGGVVLVEDKAQPMAAVGEPAVDPVSAAISNAIYDAVGVRLRELPFTPARVLAALQAKG